MSDNDLIHQIDIILNQIKSNGSAYAPNIFNYESSIGLIYYNSSDIKRLRTLKRNIILLQTLDKTNNIKTVKGELKDNRLEINKPTKPNLKYIDLNSLFNCN